jgi:hypothetical protein
MRADNDIGGSAGLRMKVGAMMALAVTMGAGSGCRSHVDLQRQYREMRPAMATGRWPVAAAQLETAKDTIYKEADRVMWWLNMGTVLHYAGDYKRSNELLVKAEEAMQELWTKSVSAEASKVLVSESLQSYPGEDFEKVLLYLYTSLNHLKLGKPGDALVEARRADEQLKKMLVQFDKEGEGGSIYRQDAFMLWLVGLLYEVEGSFNDAYLAYKAAYEGYSGEYAGKFGAGVSSFLGEDLLRTAALAGLKEDAARWQSQTGASGGSLEALKGGMAEVVLLHAAGEAPFKQQLDIDGTMPDGYVMRIAVPQFVASKHRTIAAEVSAGASRGRTELMQPVSAIALKNFEHRLPGIKARAIARAVVKYVATKGASAAANQVNGTVGALVGLLGNVASAASEAADLRAWTTLPAEIGVTRLWVPAGPQTLNISYLGPGFAPTGRREQVALDLKPGERRVLSVRTLE